VNSAIFSVVDAVLLRPMWLVIRQGMFPVLIGVVVGLAAAIGLTRLMSTI
jgi:hypothetical protein